MPLCVRCPELDPDSQTEGNNLFRGRFLCFEHFKDVMDQLHDILRKKESRENRILSAEERIPIQSPRIIHDASGMTSQIRGQHFTISKKDLRKF